MTTTSVQQSRIRLMIDEIFLVSSQIRTSQLSDINQAAHESNRHYRLLNHILAGHSRLHDRLQTPQMLTAQQDSSLHHGSPDRNLTNRVPSIVSIKTHLPMNQRHPCSISCRCNCHNVRSVGSPSILRNVLGFLFIRYSGYPLGFSHQCSDATCQSQPRFRMRTVYCFPSWLFGRTIEMNVIASHYVEPSVSLTTRGIFLPSSDISQAIHLDDDQALQQLFSNRSAWPNDVMLHSGRSALQVSIYSYSPV